MRSQMRRYIYIAICSIVPIVAIELFVDYSSLMDRALYSGSNTIEIIKIVTFALGWGFGVPYFFGYLIGIFIVLTPSIICFFISRKLTKHLL